MKYPQAALLPLLLLGLSGCNSGPQVVPIKGVVTRNGKPVKNLSVTLVPENGGRPSVALRPTDDEGRFELSYGKDTPGASIGTHKVVVAFRPSNPGQETDFYSGKLLLHPDQHAILEKYGASGTHPLIVDITPATPDLQLKLD